MKLSSLAPVHLTLAADKHISKLIGIALHSMLRPLQALTAAWHKLYIFLDSFSTFTSGTIIHSREASTSVEAGELSTMVCNWVQFWSNSSILGNLIFATKSWKDLRLAECLIHPGSWLFNLNKKTCFENFCAKQHSWPDHSWSSSGLQAVHGDGS